MGPSPKLPAITSRSAVASAGGNMDAGGVPRNQPASSRQFRASATSGRVTLGYDPGRPDSPPRPVTEFSDMAVAQFKRRPKIAQERSDAIKLFDFITKHARQAGQPLQTPYTTQLEQWLQTQLQGAQFVLPAGAKKDEGLKAEQEEEKELREQGRDLTKELKELIDKKGGLEEGDFEKLEEQSPKQIGASVSEFSNEMAKVVTGLDPGDLVNPEALKQFGSELGIVKTAAENVVSSIPMLGTIFAGLKLLNVGIKLGFLARKAYKIHEAQANSFSLLETEVLDAIQFYNKEKGVRLGQEAVHAVVVGVGSTIGAGAIVGFATGVAEWTVQIMAKIFHRRAIEITNAALRSGQISINLVRSSTLLGLHLPYLDNGVDALTLIGILPPGWRGLPQKDAIQNALRAAEKNTLVRAPDLGWLLSPLDWTKPREIFLPPSVGELPLPPPDEQTPAADSEPTGAVLPPVKGVPRLGGSAVGAAGKAIKNNNPWLDEYKRLIEILEQTDDYIGGQNWRLVKDGTMVHEPPPNGILDKLKRGWTSVKTGVLNNYRP